MPRSPKGTIIVTTTHICVLQHPAIQLLKEFLPRKPSKSVQDLRLLACLGAFLNWASSIHNPAKKPEDRQTSTAVAQRVQLECHYGIRAPKTLYGMVLRT